MMGDPRITKERLEAEVEDIYTFISVALKDGDIENFTPAMILLFVAPADERKMTVVMMPQFHDGHGEHLMAMIGQKYGTENSHVTAAFLVAEGWLSNDKSYETAEADPERKEIINIQGMTHDGRTVEGFVEVTRNEQGGMVISGLGMPRYGKEGRSSARHYFKSFWEAHLEALEKQSLPDEKKEAKWN